MMNLEINNQQTDWLAQTEELNDTEASQVNGGEGVAAQIQSLQEKVGESGANPQLQQVLGTLVQKIEEK